MWSFNRLWVFPLEWFFFSWYVPSHLIHSYLPLISIGMLSYSLDYWERESLLFGRKFLLESKSLFCSTKIFLFALISFHFDMISIGNQLVSDFTHLSEKRGILCYEKAKDFRKRKRKRRKTEKEKRKTSNSEIFDYFIHYFMFWFYCCMHSTRRWRHKEITCLYHPRFFIGKT